MAKKVRKVVPKKSVKTTLKKDMVTANRKLPSAWHLSKNAYATIKQHWRLLIGITVVYGLLNLVLVQGLSSNVNMTDLKATLSQTTKGQFDFLFSNIGAFMTLLGSAGNAITPTASAYQAFLTVIGSLAIIWALRQILSGARPSVQDAYYKGMYPLVPFLLVLFVVSLELVPLVIGSTLYVLVINNGIAVYAIEKILWGLLFIALSLLTFYLISSSLFALYIVTLKDMTPLKALRSARELVRNRRWLVLRKILWLPVFLVIITAVMILPFIIVLAPLAPWVFFMLTILALLAVHAYLYTLYRELLNE